jgi:dTDP-L-rhamnose 4-epimerase
VARAFLLALEHPKAAGQVYNVASGTDRTVEEVAIALARAMGRPELAPEITGKTRSGDIRHNIADISRIRDELGFCVQRDFAQDLAELADWVTRQQAEDRVQNARRELEQRGLVA